MIRRGPTLWEQDQFQRLPGQNKKSVKELEVIMHPVDCWNVSCQNCLSPIDPYCLENPLHTSLVNTILGEGPLAHLD